MTHTCIRIETHTHTHTHTYTHRLPGERFLPEALPLSVLDCLPSQNSLWTLLYWMYVGVCMCVRAVCNWMVHVIWEYLRQVSLWFEQCIYL